MGVLNGLSMANLGQQVEQALKLFWRLEIVEKQVMCLHHDPAKLFYQDEQFEAAEEAASCRTDVSRRESKTHTRSVEHTPDILEDHSPLEIAFLQNWHDQPFWATHFLALRHENTFEDAVMQS